MTKLVSKLCSGFRGQAVIPGDKSISHRALILSALADGNSRVEGLLGSEDVMKTKAALQQLGVTITKTANGYDINGVGPRGFKAPEGPLDFGNSGTGARLVMGLLAPYPFSVKFCGDSSLSSRPMDRVIGPLSEMGAVFMPKGVTTLPLTLTGNPGLQGIDFISPISSAQVKSAVLLAGLGTKGATSVTESTQTRDHTERMLGAFGARLDIEQQADGGVKITLKGGADLRSQTTVIPGDFSSAAFLLVAGSTIPGAEVTFEGIGINPLRTGFLDVLKAMGARVQLLNQRAMSGEPVADLRVTASPLNATQTSADIVPRMIDEFPILFVAAALARGVSEFRGLGELRLKESDRLATMAKGLQANGIGVDETSDGLIVSGSNGTVPGGGTIDACQDHRIAMAFLVLGMRAENPIKVIGAESISTSFPGFAKLMTSLGANIEEVS